MSSTSADAQSTTDVEQLGINLIRGFAMDAPHAAKSGHQGTAMALAPLAHVLWTRIMKYDADDPGWFDRDRFILSAGHASILQYSMMYLCGQGISLDDLRNFRQWESATPGHPESHTPGVEVTTGPLGQGFGNGVGMAMAERSLRARFGSDVVDHHTYVVCGDGDLAEGVSHEAASLAGFLGLGRLICIYDDNHVSIDGPTEEWLTDDAAGRFTSYGWHVEDLGEAGDDLDALEAALRRAQDVTDRPSLLIVRTHIGTPSPDLTDAHEAHGYAFKDDEISATKAAMGMPDEPFHTDEATVAWYHEAGRRGAAEREAWSARVDALGDDRAGFDACLSAGGVGDWSALLPSWDDGESVATRKASNNCLDAIVDAVPSLVVGAADLTGNTGVKLAGQSQMTSENPEGRQVFYGVREHAMGAAMNGMALHGGVLPVGGTFLVFSDYCRPSVRLAALQCAKVIYSFTHDSVGVGEDGPTHQPVEHVAALRTIPDLSVIRPADATEVAGAWAAAVAGDGPTALILTRQNVPVLAGTTAQDVALGGYVVVEDPAAAITLIGAGSEVHLCVAAAEALQAAGTAARVVSMPSWNLFEAATPEHRSSVLTGGPSLAVEAGVSLGWHRYADDVVSIDRFGASAPGDVVMDKLGINVDNIVSRAQALLA